MCLSYKKVSCLPIRAYYTRDYNLFFIHYSKYWPFLHILLCGGPVKGPPGNKGWFSYSDSGVPTGLSSALQIEVVSYSVKDFCDCVAYHHNFAPSASVEKINDTLWNEDELIELQYLQVSDIFCKFRNSGLSFRTQIWSQYTEFKVQLFSFKFQSPITFLTEVWKCEENFQWC